MSKRGPHPLEDTLTATDAKCRRAVDDASNREVVRKFHLWVLATHERCEKELAYLSSRRTRLFYITEFHPDPQNDPDFMAACANLGRNQEYFLLLDDYVTEISSNVTGEFDLTHPAGVALWSYYLEHVLGIPNPAQASPTHLTESESTEGE